MTLKTKKGAALSYVLIAGVLLFVLAAALLPVASGITKSSVYSADHKISYIDAKSAIEYAKAVIKHKIETGDELSSFYVEALPDGSGGLDFTYINGAAPSPGDAYAVCVIDEDENKVTIEAQGSRLGYQGSFLGVTLELTPGMSVLESIPAGYAQVGNALGDDLVLKGNGQRYYYNATVILDPFVLITPREYNLMPILFKNTENLNGVYYMLMAKSLYFMGSPSLTASNAYLEVMTNVLYLSGNINAEDSKLIIQAPNEASDSDSVFIYFDDVTINSNRSGTISLDGLYEFEAIYRYKDIWGWHETRRELDLFNVNDLNSSAYFKKSEGGAGYEQAMVLLDDNILNSTAEQRENWISAEEAGWLSQGSINGNSTPQPGKSVSMYVTDTESFDDYTSLSYSARTIRVRSYIKLGYDYDFDINVGKYSYYWYGPVYNPATIKFSAEYLCFENLDEINKKHSNSEFLIIPPEGGKLILEFNQDTEVNYNSRIGIIKKGIYEVSSTINLFDYSLYGSNGINLPPFSGEITAPSEHVTDPMIGNGVYYR